MNDIELTKLFISYSECKDLITKLEEQITKELLKREESMKVAGVTAVYYKPTQDIDYEAAAKTFMPEDFDLLPYSTIKTTVRWKDVVEVLGVLITNADLEKFTTEKPARIVIKVKE